MKTLLQEARMVCRRVARAHYENFPVGRWWLSPRRREDIQAVYAFARIADDFADEPEYAAKRLELLERWGERLEACVREPADHPVFLALGDTISRRRLPLEPFRDLLSAFKQDAVQQRYETWDEVLDYCRRSANPVGRLVLAVAGRDDPALHPLADALCTGLQLTNFWQDLAVDLKRGRCYLPRADAASGFRVDVDAWVAGAVAGTASPGAPPVGAAELLEELTDRTAVFFEVARALPRRAGGWLRLELGATWLGGRAVLDQVVELGAEALTERPVLGLSDKATIVLQALLGRV